MRMPMRVRFCQRAPATILAAAFLFVAIAHCAGATIIYQTGSLGSEIARLDSLVFPQQSGLYVAPNSTQRTAFRTLATSLMNGSYATAATQAEALGYELVSFFDTETWHSYYILREHLNAQGTQNLGWGNYIWNPVERSDVLVTATHPQYDTNTPEFAIDVFQGLSGRCMLMAGAHRNQDGSIYGIADVASQTNTIFEAVFETWTSPSTLPIEIHGFDWDKHTNFPYGTDIVMSNGNGAVLQPHIDLDAAFEAAGLQSYVYNTLSPSAPLNILVNNGVAGSTFSSLSATGNAQGQYTRNTYSAPFVHCEIEQSVRIYEPELWQPAVDAIVSAIGTPTPEPLTILTIAAGLAVCGAAAFQRRA